MKESLINVHNALNQIEVRNKNNLALLVGCMNELEKLIQQLGEAEASEASAAKEGGSAE